MGGRRQHDYRDEEKIGESCRSRHFESCQLYRHGSTSNVFRPSAAFSQHQRCEQPPSLTDRATVLELTRLSSFVHSPAEVF